MERATINMSVTGARTTPHPDELDAMTASVRSPRARDDLRWHLTNTDHGQRLVTLHRHEVEAQRQARAAILEKLGVR